MKTLTWSKTKVNTITHDQNRSESVSFVNSSDDEGQWQELDDRPPTGTFICGRREWRIQREESELWRLPTTINAKKWRPTIPPDSNPKKKMLSLSLFSTWIFFPSYFAGIWTQSPAMALALALRPTHSLFLFAFSFLPFRSISVWKIRIGSGNTSYRISLFICFFWLGSEIM